MNKCFMLILLMLSLQVHALEDKVTCADKNNVLQFLTTDESGYPGYYQYVYLVSLKSQTVGDGQVTVSLAAGDTLSVYDTNVINHDKIQFKSKLMLEGNSNTVNLPPFTIDLSITEIDAHDATVAELESLGSFEVLCQAVPIEDHASQLGRYNAEHRLLQNLN